MNRLEKLKLKIAEEYARKVGYGVEDLVIWEQLKDAHKSGFDAASAEYENIIAELEGALKMFTETVDHRAVIASYPIKYVSRAREALQKLKEFKNTEE